MVFGNETVESRDAGSLAGLKLSNLSELHDKPLVNSRLRGGGLPYEGSGILIGQFVSPLICTIKVEFELLSSSRRVRTVELEFFEFEKIKHHQLENSTRSSVGIPDGIQTDLAFALGLELGRGKLKRGAICILRPIPRGRIPLLALGTRSRRRRRRRGKGEVEGEGEDEGEYEGKGKDEAEDEDEGEGEDEGGNETNTKAKAKEKEKATAKAKTKTKTKTKAKTRAKAKTTIDKVEVSDYQEEVEVK